MKRASLLAALVLAAVTAVEAQKGDPLDEVRALYESAAYEDALTQLSKVTAPDASAGRIEQYRAFCLIALGRVEEASSAVVRAVIADPLLVPSTSDASPRVRAFFTEARRKVLPDVTRDAYVQAKTAYAAKDFAAAAAGFRRVVDLVDSAAGEGEGLADLRLLAREFLDLSSRAVVAPLPALAETRTSAAASTPAASVPVTRGPVVVRQKMPIWTGVGAPKNYDGLLRLQIDEQGAVNSAIIMRPTDPRYDAELTLAAKQWKYEPAMSNGKPVPSEKDITFVLKRQQ